MTLSKKLEFAILSFSNALIFGVVFTLFRNSPIFYILILLSVINIAIWYRFFKIYKSNLVIPKLIFITLYSIGGTLLLFVFPNINLLMKPLYIINFSASLYVLMLATNIFIASEKSEEVFPLIHPAKVVVFVLLLFSVFSWANVAYKLPFIINVSGVLAYLLQVIFLGAIFSLLFMFSGWFILGGWVGEVTENLLLLLKKAQIFIIVTLVQLSMVLSLFPYEDFARAMILGAVTYALVNIVGSYLGHKDERRVYLDAGAVIVMAFVLAYYL